MVDNPAPQNIRIGQVLKDTREAQNLSLTDVSTKTKIREVYLSALEEGRYDDLPGDVYIVGFIRSYSNLLGLDGDSLAETYQSQAAPAPIPMTNITNMEEPPARPPWWIAVAALIAFIVIALAITLLSGQDDETANAPTAAVVTPAVEEQPAAQTVKTLPDTGVALRATGSTWVQVKGEDGADLFQQVLNAGDVYIWPAGTTASLHVSNAGLVELAVDGDVLGALGEKGNLRKIEAFNPQNAASFVAQPEAEEEEGVDE